MDASKSQDAPEAAGTLQRLGRGIALAGVVLPLLLIGGLKFTAVEIEGLKPLIGGTPWLAWMYPVFGEAGASYFLGVVEIATALLLIASPWSARAAVAGGLLAAITFLVTCSIMVALPIWEPKAGGFPALGFLGQFLIKDIALLGISLVVLGEGLARLKAR
ncbi:YkgB family protein [Mesorhizobium sp. ZC-5]|uniref:YkgB family protein n=1 Tax=Mesorhizobium sp. ZC-5 TaxID=2986066 RepID=UPI0021E7EEF1|nr:YkgB family protein [Mesorhizobium sp. ZC-5]MCV3241818.1 YkgB family protein [Mesorhizobium sp. ZC-5]